MRPIDTRERRSGRWAALALALLSTNACGEQRLFDSTIWKAEAGTIASQSSRKQMVRDFSRKFPTGTSKAAILTELGPPDADIPELCTERRADDCLVYSIGSSGVDPDYFVVAFADDRLVSSWQRAT